MNDIACTLNSENVKVNVVSTSRAPYKTIDEDGDREHDWLKPVEILKRTCDHHFDIAELIAIWGSDLEVNKTRAEIFELTRRNIEAQYGPLHTGRKSGVIYQYHDNTEFMGTMQVIVCRDMYNQLCEVSRDIKNFGGFDSGIEKWYYVFNNVFYRWVRDIKVNVTSGRHQAEYQPYYVMVCAIYQQRQHSSVAYLPLL